MFLNWWTVAKMEKLVSIYTVLIIMLVKTFNYQVLQNIYTSMNNGVICIAPNKQLNNKYKTTAIPNKS